jgi:hypothetical protein
MTRYPNPEVTVSAREGSTAVAADEQNYVAEASTTTGGGAQANSA